MLLTEKRLIPDSGGAGRTRGGLSQCLTFEATGPKPVTVTYRHERVQNPPRGILGGQAGRGGRDLVNGAPVAAKARITLAPGDRITFETPGGGGMGPPAERDPAAIAQDIAEGYVTEAGAKAYRA
jgi:N-methylhydantoinase B